MKAFAKLASSTGSIALVEVPRPSLAQHEILVKIAAIGVGVHDEYFHAPHVSYPYIIGIEGAGIVDAVGQDVTGVVPGDRIAFVSSMQPKGGVWAEYAVISDHSLILNLPEGMSFEQAAAVPVAGNTAIKTLILAGLVQGETLFVAGGAGAIGTVLIQIASKRGIRVIASASRKNHDYLKMLGASYTVDYHDSDWHEQVRSLMSAGVDAAIAVHPGTPTEAQSVVKDGGILVAVSGDQLTPERGIILKQVFGAADAEYELNELMNQVVSGEIRLVIDEVHPFEEALIALEQAKARHTRGKIVLTMSLNLDS